MRSTLSQFGSRKLVLILTVLIAGISASAFTFGDTILAPLGFAREGASFSNSDSAVRLVSDAKPIRVGTLPGLTSPSMFVPQVFVDDAGADDEPGQKDLNALSVDYANQGAGTLEVTWNWDNTSTSGANTRDACSLFDTDGDGNANFSYCVIVDSDGSFTDELYSCGDDAVDRCTQPTETIANFDTTATATVVAGSDPFGNPGPNFDPAHVTGNTCATNPACYTDDTVAVVHIDLNDFGNPANAVLLNVCSYPSQQPNSDPSDCVITPDQPRLKLVKVVTNDNGGNAVANDWDLTATGTDGTFTELTPDAANATFHTVFGGVTYTLSESGPTGYTASSFSCSIDGGPAVSGNSINLDFGEEAVCTITNNDIAPTVTLTKVVINDNGGTAQPNDFALTVGGISVQSGVSTPVAANTALAINETLVSGYSFVSITGNAKCPAVLGGTVTLDEGESVSCTITNNDQAASLIIIKNVINDDGGDAVAGDFGGTIGGTATFAGGSGWTGTVAPGQTKNMIAAGTYSVSENAAAGYAVSYSAGCAGSIALGESKTCTVTNDDVAPTLRLLKTVTNDNGGTATPADFTLFAASVAPTATRNFSYVGNLGVFQTIFANVGYVLSESSLPGYTAGNWSCSGGTLVGSTITLNEGQTNITCTINNDDQAANLIIIKSVVNDNGGTAVASDFSGTIGGTATFAGGNTWTGAASPGQTKAMATAGTYSVTENAAPGYSVSYSPDCTGSIALGQSKTCTVTNNDIGPTLRVIKDVVPDSDTGLFNLRIDGATAGTGANVGDGGTTGFVPVNAGSHTVSETAGTNTTLSDYVTVIGGDCAANGTVTLGLAQNKTCTITNTKKGEAKVIKTRNGAVLADTQAFEFTLRTGATSSNVGTILETDTADAGNGGVITFDTLLIPGDTYQLCEMVPVGYTSDLLNAFVIQTEPDGDNSTVCVNFTVGAGELKTFNVNNSVPLGDARTIGYWKNHASCKKSNGKQLPVLDYVLWSFGKVAFVDSEDTPSSLAGLHLIDSPPYDVGIPINTAGGTLFTVDTCEEAVALLNKSRISDGKKQASDPVFNMAAQLIAAILNIQAGADPSCIEPAIDEALKLLELYNFNGNTHATVPNTGENSQAEMNYLAGLLDAYNNNDLACPIEVDNTP